MRLQTILFKRIIIIWVKMQIQPFDLGFLKKKKKPFDLGHYPIHYVLKIELLNHDGIYNIAIDIFVRVPLFLVNYH